MVRRETHAAEALSERLGVFRYSPEAKFLANIFLRIYIKVKPCFPGFLITKMIEDGSCLFRAVADQIYGDQEMHPCVRRNCMDYIVSRIGQSLRGLETRGQWYVHLFGRFLEFFAHWQFHKNNVITLFILCEVAELWVEIFLLKWRGVNVTITILEDFHYVVCCESIGRFSFKQIVRSISVHKIAVSIVKITFRVQYFRKPLYW
jgi:hypothetical protein